MKNTKKIILGTSLFLAIGTSPALAYELWADGVNRKSGWSDWTQVASDCGPSTASNMLNWWLGKAEQDYVLPMDLNDPDPSWRGYNIWKVASDYGNKQAHVKDALFDYASYYNFNFEKSHHRTPFYIWGSNGDDAQESYEEISKEFRTYLGKGAVGGITKDSPSHAQTCWGAEFDETTGLVTKLFITDSAKNRPMGALEIYEFFNVSEQGVCFSTKRTLETGGVEFTYLWIDCIDFLWYDKNAVIGLTPLIPEPSAFGLLAGLGALVLVQHW